MLLAEDQTAPHQESAFFSLSELVTTLTELAAMAAYPSHHQPGREIPERSLAYRFAKKYWFFGFGAYG